MTRRVLVTGHGRDRDPVNAVRRAFAYDTLEVLTSRPDDPDLAALRENEALAGVAVAVTSVADAFPACLAAGGEVLDRHARDHVRVHVGGGPNALASALLLGGFERGLPTATWSPRHGVRQLPVVVDVEVTERFGRTERAVLLALRTAAVALDDLAVDDLAPATVKTTLLRLRRLGLVDADHREARLTASGAYYRRHLENM